METADRARGVVVLGAVVGGVVLLRPSSANSTACKLYEDAYNKLAEAVRMKGDGVVDSDYVRAQLTLMPDRVQDALRVAHDDVAVEIRSSQELASGYAYAQDNGHRTRTSGSPSTCPR